MDAAGDLAASLVNLSVLTIGDEQTLVRVVAPAGANRLLVEFVNVPKRGVTWTVPASCVSEAEAPAGAAANGAAAPAGTFFDEVHVGE